MPQLGNFLRVTISLLIFDVVVYALYYRHVKKEREKKVKRKVNDCVIFHSDAYDCGTYCSHEVDRQNKGYLFKCMEHSLQKVLQRIKQSKSTVDIALYLFVCPELIASLIHEAKKGRSVRVLMDGNSNEDLIRTSLVEQIVEAGIQMKKVKSRFIFHHKFIIIDKELLIQGSCNLTSTGIRGNCDNLIITSNKLILKKYVDFYESLWQSNDI